MWVLTEKYNVMVRGLNLSWIRKVQLCLRILSVQDIENIKKRDKRWGNLIWNTLDKIRQNKATQEWAFYTQTFEDWDDLMMHCTIGRGRYRRGVADQRSSPSVEQLGLGTWEGEDRREYRGTVQPHSWQGKSQVFTGSDRYNEGLGMEVAQRTASRSNATRIIPATTEVRGSVGGSAQPTFYPPVSVGAYPYWVSQMSQMSVMDPSRQMFVVEQQSRGVLSGPVPLLSFSAGMASEGGGVLSTSAPMAKGNDSRQSALRKVVKESPQSLDAKRSKRARAEMEEKERRERDGQDREGWRIGGLEEDWRIVSPSIKRPHQEELFGGPRQSSTRRLSASGSARQVRSADESLKKKVGEEAGMLWSQILIEGQPARQPARQPNAELTFSY